MYTFDSVCVNVDYECLRWLNELVGDLDMFEVHTILLQKLYM